jgi:DNA modification methylase
MIDQHTEYRAFLEAKIVATHERGRAIDPGAVNPICKPHQAAIIRWAVSGGRRAIFAKFGLGKTIMMLETMRLTLEPFDGARGLIIAPLGVRQEFLRDAAMLGTPISFVRTTAEMSAPGLYLTNYESVREGKISVDGLTAVGLDEAAILRGFGGTKTFREFMAKLAGDDRETGIRTDGIPFRFVATATPSPNDYIEIAAYSAFLGIMDVGEVKTRYFKRDSEKADQLTLYPHKEAEFWYWVNTWAVFLQSPADLGFDAEGYELPPLTVKWHTVHVDHSSAGFERDGQAKLLRDSAIGITDAAAVKRTTLSARIAKVKELIDARPDDHVIVWHDLEDERRALEDAIPGIVTVYGAQDLDEREVLIRDFADGRVARIGAKPVMLGSGVNFQRHCHWAIFAGIGFKFSDFIQAIHRVWRYLQPGEVTIDIIFADAETEVKRSLEAKWKRHEVMMARMAEIIKEYGLNSVDAREKLVRSIGVTREETSGEGWTAVHNDCVEECAGMQSNSVGLVVTSIPFGTQYEYSPSYNDFGHTDDDDHFWQQMGFLSPELLRVLKPGRIMAVHVKDRIRPGGLDGWSFQTVSAFHADAIHHYRRHGFAYMGMITVSTDVVRENAQTYRLGWSEQCKDGTKMGVGLPEYVLLFRKPPTDRTVGYADERVVKDKSEYSRARWQFDAHALWRSDGNRLLAPEDLVGVDASQAFQRFREYSATSIYSHDHMVSVAEARDRAGQLPPGFMLLQPDSHLEDVWTDVTRMRTLNGAQYAAGKEMHICPLQFDIVDRLITRFSNRGDVVLDPFGGLMTVPLRAADLGRVGYGVELARPYWVDGVWYLRAAEEKRSTPTLFDLQPVEAA